MLVLSVQFSVLRTRSGRATAIGGRCESVLGGSATASMRSTPPLTAIRPSARPRRQLACNGY